MIANIIRNRKKTGSNVSLLLHMDGANGSTVFTDSGPNALAVTAIGNARVSTAQSKYGGASVYLDGAGSSLQIQTTTAFGFGTGNYTAEFWFYISGGQGTSRQLLDFRTSDSAPATLYITFNDGLSIYNGSQKAFATTVLTTGVWYHVALCRSSGITRCFLNGVLEWSTSNVMNFTSSRPLGIGGYIPFENLTGVFNGYIDEVRISNGLARYTANFTPPASAYPDA